MPRFRKKPVEIEAMHFVDDEEPSLIVDWILANGGVARWHPFEGALGCVNRKGRPETPEHLSIDTLEGVMRADVGDWIIRGVKGEFYPCKPDIFEATYDAVEGPPLVGGFVP